MDIDPSVFEFSSQSNLIHLLPDGLQGDVVREVFEQHPDLAEKFRGFTLFTNHLGLYQGTAASLFTILTGEPWELESGYSSTRARQGIQSKSYQKSLYEQDYQLDYVPIDDYVCPDYVSTCYPRPFSDLKSRGYYRHQSEDVSYGLRLIGDLTLFRLTPMYLKEKIYNDGHWFMSDTAMDGSSPWPDPVLREWTQRMTIVDDRPVYKWYHYIGTHIPPHWNDQCEYFRELPRERESFKAQAYCILQGIANLADRLRESGVYDRTAFVVSSDHGHIEPPDDLHSLPYNASLDASLMGTGRPTLLIKTKNSNQALAFSDTPTSLVDVAATALHLVGIKSDQNNVSDFKNLQQRQREFTPYFIQKFWSKKPIPHVKYRVDGPASDASEWRLSDMIEFDPAPAGYDPVNFNTANRYVLGAALDRNQPDEEASWVKGRQLGFLLHIPESKTQRSMALVLKLPEWITQQALTLAVNGVQTGQTYEMGGTGDGWQTLKIPLDPTLLKPGNNFFNILFENTQSPPGEDDWHASAILKSIRVLE